MSVTGEIDNGIILYALIFWLPQRIKIFGPERSFERFINIDCSMKYAALICLQTIFCSSLWSQDSPFGRWTAIDDIGGHPTSQIEIYEHDGKLHGKIVKLLNEPSEILCRQCQGEKHNQPILGMEIIWNMALDGDSWKGGKIMDPKNGKVYKCKIELGSADELKVRGFVGMPALGRTQTWHRLK